MRRATRIVATLLGLTAGIAGMGHGYFEILQGNTQPDGLVITSIGPPCNPETMYSACEPAMTIIPSFLITGILAVVLGLLVSVWSAGYVHRKHGGWILVLLSIALLLFGGGFFPPIIGIIAGFTATRMNKNHPAKKPGWFIVLMASLWPWPLVIFLLWTYGQLLVGNFFNDFLQKIMIYGISLILVTLILSVVSASAHDRLIAARLKETRAAEDPDPRG
jgi:MFS family permease